MILHRVSWVRVVGRVGVERGGAGGRAGGLGDSFARSEEE